MNVKPELSIVIPCLNEAINITHVINQLEGIVTSSPYRIEVLVVDGGSTDTSHEELTQRFQSLPSESFKLILNTQRKGYGADIMQALDQARGDVLAWTHADMQTDPADVITAYKRFLQAKNAKVMIKGKRKNRNKLDHFFTLAMQYVVRGILKKDLNDINAQPKLFAQDFYQKHLQGQAPADFSLDLYLLYQAQAHSYDIVDIPVYFNKRIHGEAKGGGGFQTKIRLIKRTWRYIHHLKKAYPL
jgi:glycosyltransferase involved in cell wall biosynthesis